MAGCSVERVINVAGWEIQGFDSIIICSQGLKNVDSEKL
jgi:hypothetical protein